MKKYFIVVAFLAASTLCAIAQNNNLLEASINNEGKPVILDEGKRPISSPYDTSSLNEVLKLANEQHPMEKIGKVLTFIGLPLAVIGGAMVSQADALYYECYNGECEGDPKGGFGVIFLAAGVGLSGTGIVLWSIGRAKR